jgi:hypothetical protein
LKTLVQCYKYTFYNALRFLKFRLLLMTLDNVD